MTKKIEDYERKRKAYAPDGTRGQKHVAFRLDLENLEHLNKQPNKGRYLNELIRKDREKE